MKKTLIRAVSFLVTLSLLTGLLAPLAGAVEYEGVTSLSIDAKSALLIDMDTEQVLYEQAADEQRYPASITKIMTALLTLEAVGRGELDLNDVITMDAAALADLTPDSSTAGLQAGEEITVRNLLYCLLLASANEAANALAIAVAGDIPTFVEQMNQRAQELGMSGTHFVNPHGLHSDDHYTTARDIFKMAKQAMTHATFREIVSTGTYTVPATNLSGERTLYNTNALLTSALHPGYTYSGTIGIKTGSTGQAGYCLTAAVEMKGHTLISVVLGAENPTDSQGNVQRMQFSESVRLLDWASDNFSAATLLDSETYLQEIPVRFSADTSHVVLRPAQSVRALIPGTYDDTRLELRLRLNSEVASAPISAGDIPVRVENAPDEMGELSGAFNRMSERLAAAYQKLEQSNSQLAGILQGMNDGVVAVDGQGRIALMTDRARELLGSYAGVSRRLADCGTHYLAVQAMLDRVMAGEKPFTETLTLAAPTERILEIYAARVEGDASGGALAVISDVTRLRKLEIMRSEFVANVTHELKTPLTSIRGYIELLKSEERDRQTALSFYEIIEIEAERLQKLTDDLLQLSDIEHGGGEAEVVPVPLEEVVDRVIATLRPEAEARNIALHPFIEPGLQVCAQSGRLYQLIKNLMENAVKYNRDGGAVNLSAAVERGVAVIRVHDTGIGIPPEHLERIFERFYRVDKGRSRELGGTGLGLSIVKHIVSLYGGDVRVDSAVGVGTTFTVRLPCR